LWHSKGFDLGFGFADFFFQALLGKKENPLKGKRIIYVHHSYKMIRTSFGNKVYISILESEIFSEKLAYKNDL
jgi:hypothetical protein